MSPGRIFWAFFRYISERSCNPLVVVDGCWRILASATGLVTWETTVQAAKTGLSQAMMWLRLLFSYVRPATLLPVFDLLLVNLAALFALWIWALRGHQPFGLGSALAQIHWFAILSALWLWFAVVQGFYRPERRKEPLPALLSLFWINVLLVLCYIVVYFFAPDGLLPRGVVLYFATASFVFVGLWRLAYIAVATDPVGDHLRLAMTYPQVTAGTSFRREDAEECYRGLFDGVPLGLYRATPEGWTIDANLASVEMLGFPDRDTLLAASVIAHYVNPEDRRRWQALIEREGIVSDFEVQLRRRDGRIIWVRENARAIRDDAGRVLYCEGSLEDITAHKQAEEALPRHAERPKNRHEVDRSARLGQSLRGQVLTVQEVAGLLKVSQTTVWRWCQSGKLPAFRVGQQWRIHGQELEERIEELMRPEE